MSTVPYPLPDHPAAVWVSPAVAWEHFTGGVLDDPPACPECGWPIVDDDPDFCHTPGTERYHASCCPDCTEVPDVEA